jgi:hypothetical protein
MADVNQSNLGTYVHGCAPGQVPASAGKNILPNYLRTTNRVIGKTGIVYFLQTCCLYFMR